ncbi:MAG: hypothetical protein ABIN68_02095, partial [Sphingomicrobium sp.]
GSDEMIDEQELFRALQRMDVLEGHEPRSAKEPIEWETAHALCEISRASKQLESSLEIAQSADPVRAADALHDAREAIRHIAYHIGDSSYLAVVLPES